MALQRLVRLDLLESLVVQRRVKVRAVAVVPAPTVTVFRHADPHVIAFLAVVRTVQPAFVRRLVTLGAALVGASLNVARLFDLAHTARNLLAAPTLIINFGTGAVVRSRWVHPIKGVPPTVPAAHFAACVLQTLWGDAAVVVVVCGISPT